MSEKKNMIPIFEDIIRSFQIDSDNIVEQINWIVKSDNSFSVDKNELKQLIKDLSIVQASIEQAENFVEQIMEQIILQQNDLGTEGDISDSSDD